MLPKISGKYVALLRVAKKKKKIKRFMRLQLLSLLLLLFLYRCSIANRVDFVSPTIRICLHVKYVQIVPANRYCTTI